jgi:acyl-CoA thioesterase
VCGESLTLLLREPAGWVSVHVFDLDTGVRPIGDGRFAAAISDRWNVNSGDPNGGYLMALCARALGELVPKPDALVLAGHFLRPGAPGDAVISTELVRAGRRLATGEARLVQGEKEVLRVIGTFGTLDEAAGPTTLFDRPPSLPDPQDCVDPVEDPIPLVTISEHVDYRYAEMPGWRVGRPSGCPEAAFWMRFRDAREVDRIGVACLVDAGASAVMDLGAGGSTTVEITVHLRGKPATRWIACRAVTRYITGGFHEEDVELWDEDGNLVAQARQLAILR